MSPPCAADNRPSEARRRGFESAQAIGAETLISRALAPCPTRLETTWWNRVEETGDGDPVLPGRGVRVASSLGDFAAWLERCAQEFRAKGSSRVFVHGPSLWGGSEDAQCTRIDWTWNDCDHGEDWTPLLAALDRLGVAYVASRSGGHKPSHPKWHVHFPIAAPLVPPQCPSHANPSADAGSPERLAWTAHERAVRGWKRSHYSAPYEVVCGVLEALGAMPLGSFDAAPGNRLFQPSYPAARRAVDAPIAEVIHREGHAFDWAALRAAVGYEPIERAEPEEIEPEIADAWVRALRCDGLYVREIGDDRHAVRCPWAGTHSSNGTESSTVLLAGRFHCSHTSHGPKTNADVRAILSPAARAIIDGTEERAKAQRARMQLLANGVVERTHVILGRVERSIVDALDLGCMGGSCRGRSEQ